MELGEAAARRRSSRSLTGRPLDRRVLEDVLGLACARVERVRAPGGSYDRFAYPTAGGLGATCVRVLAWNVPGLPRGVHRYEPRTRELVRCEAALPPRAAFAEMAAGQEWALGASAALLLAADERAVRAKYGPLAERLLLLEAGHCAQMAALALTEAGLPSVLVGGFDAERAAALCAPLVPQAFLLTSPALPERPDWDAPDAALPDDRAPEPADAPCRTHRAGRLSLAIARRRVPATAHWATGCAPDGPATDAEALARTRAAAEAREIWTGLSAVPPGLVHAEPAALGARVVEPEALVPDRRQRRAILRGQVDPAHGAGRARHWIAAGDRVTGERVWLPASAVLLGQRFFDWNVLPTSSGMACAPSRPAAEAHAWREMLERTVCPYASGGVPVDARRCRSGEVSALESALAARREALDWSVTRVGPLFFAQARVSRGFTGSAVADTPHDAAAAAVSECCCKVLEGGADEPRDDPPPLFATAPDRDLDEILERNGLRVAVCTLAPSDEPPGLLAGWPVVKMVAYRDGDRLRA